MLNDLPAGQQVYLITGYTDLRRSIDGLASIIQGQLNLDPFSTALFLFCVAQENAALRSRVAVLEEELALIREQLAWLKKQVFGRKTEQSSVIMDNGQQLTLFQEEQGQSAKNAEETITVPEHKRKKKRTHDDWMSKLPVEEIEHKEEHPICENCGAEMKEIGKEKAHDELVFTPAKYHIRRHIV